MVKRSLRGAHGASLVELMVTVAVMGMLVMAVLPLTTRWADQQMVTQSQQMLVTALAQLRATALRNTDGKSLSDPAAVLVVSDAKVCVHRGTPLALNCQGAVWSADMRSSVQLHAQAQQCLAMNSMGQALRRTVGATECNVTGAYAVSRGGESRSAELL
ncbi:Tfp pilus assembly protein FimT/FimU [Roseateles sp. BYS180W]|uniref:Tfp pilus assembly protein FimT/FimU n=1 Tax=Roseateles rivi TaxID=3299028 RepID=A0ABW7FTB0_9BURK